MTFRIPSYAIGLLLVLCAGGAAVHAATGPQPDIELSLIRVVRVATTSITISYTTDRSSTGMVRYTAEDGEVITLTDSVPQTDHLFTIDQLDPAHGYTFVLSAEDDSAASNKYSTLLAPESIGEPGQSLVPPVDEYSVDGTKVASSLGTSTAPSSADGPPAWIFALTAFGVIGAWVLNRYSRKLHSER